jgi:hypothetical protein
MIIFGKPRRNKVFYSVFASRNHSFKTSLDIWADAYLSEFDLKVLESYERVNAAQILFVTLYC